MHTEHNRVGQILDPYQPTAEHAPWNRSLRLRPPAQDRQAPDTYRADNSGHDPRDSTSRPT